MKPYITASDVLRTLEKMQTESRSRKKSKLFIENKMSRRGRRAKGRKK